jgi:NAD(P)-dependent dehydrogenase (short-subunit alcohol dehydrogenase family)
MSLELDLGGRVAVVTGAASGLALEIARAIAEAGEQVALADVGEARLAEVAATGLPVRIDVTDEKSHWEPVVAVNTVGPFVVAREAVA